MDENQTKRGGRVVIWATGTPLALVGCYLLSFGPACRWAAQLNRRDEGDDWKKVELITWLYTPINELGKLCGPFQSLMDWYAWMWS